MELTTLEDIKDSYAKAIKGDKKAINFLIDNLGNKNSEIQQESYISITKIGYPATPFLVELLKNDDPDLQEYAAGALGTIKDKQSFPALLDALSSSSFKRKYIICRALGKISDPIAIKPLISIYLEQTEDTKKYIVRALVDIGHPSVPVLLENLKNANPEIQKMSIIALGEIKGSDISKALIEISNNTNRDLVIYSLGQIADTTSIDFLLPLLKDPDWQIRQKTAFALTKYTNKKILPALNAALNDEVAIVREWVATAIECISGERCKYKNEKGELVYSHGLYH
ncbi:HEAT repeat domain-containing protein [Candidatus Poribacteria bacterium]|nr:HEAT repeat domain-containing protein [Candidatus Poribacteria bacterium]